jgi:hypothetical protein
MVIMLLIGMFTAVYVICNEYGQNKEQWPNLEISDTRYIELKNLIGDNQYNQELFNEYMNDNMITNKEYKEFIHEIVKEVYIK